MRKWENFIEILILECFSAFVKIFSIERKLFLRKLILEAYSWHFATFALLTLKGTPPISLQKCATSSENEWFFIEEKRKTHCEMRKVLFLDFPITPIGCLLLGRPALFSFSNLKVLRKKFSFCQAKWSIVYNRGFWIISSRVVFNFV